MNGEQEKKPLELADSNKDHSGQGDRGSMGASLGICFGCAFGLLAQVLTGEVMWLSLAVAVGFGLGFAIGNIPKQKKGR